jgi:hypothetical protein
MVTAVFAETLEDLLHSSLLIPETCMLNYSRGKRSRIIFLSLYKIWYGRGGGVSVSEMFQFQVSHEVLYSYITENLDVDKDLGTV